MGLSGGESAGGTGVTSGGCGGKVEVEVPSRAGGEKRGGLVTDSALQPRGSVEPFSHAETQHFVKFNVYFSIFFSFYVQLGDTVSTLMSSSYINIVRCREHCLASVRTGAVCSSFMTVKKHCKSA